MKTTWTHKYTQWAERSICCKILIFHTAGEGRQNDICFVLSLDTDWPSSCVACHRTSVLSPSDRQTISNPTPTSCQMTLDWFALLLRMRADPGYHIPDQGQATPPELFFSRSRAPGSTAFTPQHSTLRTVSYRRCRSTNKFCRSTDRHRFFDDGRFLLNIYCKESMQGAAGFRAGRVCDNYRWVTRRHLGWERGING